MHAVASDNCTMTYNINAPINVTPSSTGSVGMQWGFDPVGNRIQSQKPSYYWWKWKDVAFSTKDYSNSLTLRQNFKFKSPPKAQPVPYLDAWWRFVIVIRCWVKTAIGDLLQWKII